MQIVLEDDILYRNGAGYKFQLSSERRFSKLARYPFRYTGHSETGKIYHFLAGLFTQLTQYIQGCEACIKHMQPKHPLLQSHEMPEYPFQFITMDIIFAKYKNRRRFLIAVHHYSDFLNWMNYLLSQQTHYFKLTKGTLAIMVFPNKFE